MDVQSPTNISSLDCVLHDSVFSCVDRLLKGKIRIDPYCYSNLTAIAEAITLHENAWLVRYIITNKRSPLGEYLLQEGALKELQPREIDPQDTRAASVLQLAAESVVHGLRAYAAHETLLGFRFRDNIAQDEYDNLLLLLFDSFSKVVTLGPDWPSQVFDKEQFGYLESLMGLATLTAEAPIPVYNDTLWLPFQLNLRYHNSFSRETYRKLSDQLRMNEAKLQKIFSIHRAFIPPLLAILLSRCRTRDDIPEQLLRLRNECTGLRAQDQYFETYINNAATLGDQMDILTEYETARCRVIEELSGKLQNTHFIQRVWDIVKSGKPLTILVKGIDAAVEYLKGQRMAKGLKSFTDIAAATRNIRNYGTIIQDVFGSEMHPQLLNEFEGMSHRLETYVTPDDSTS